MVSKDKIIRASVYDEQDNLLFSTKAIDWPRDFFRIKHKELCMLKGKNIPEMRKDTPVYIIFEYLNGTRVKCRTVIDLCTEHQINIHVDDGQVLEERRRSYKIAVTMPASISFFIRDEKTVQFDEPLQCSIRNINLGGVLLDTSYEFSIGDCVSLSLIDGELDLLTEILRRQVDKDGSFKGYGCKFTGMTPPQEERIARYIFDVQLAEREKKKKLAGSL